MTEERELEREDDAFFSEISIIVIGLIFRQELLSTEQMTELYNEAKDLIFRSISKEPIQ